MFDGINFFYFIFYGVCLRFVCCVSVDCLRCLLVYLPFYSVRLWFICVFCLGRPFTVFNRLLCIYGVCLRFNCFVCVDCLLHSIVYLAFIVFVCDLHALFV